jgi:hypothetical protein
MQFEGSFASLIPLMAMSVVFAVAYFEYRRIRRR